MLNEIEMDISLPTQAFTKVGFLLASQKCWKPGRSFVLFF